MAHDVQTLLKVIIPIYIEKLPAIELHALQNNLRVLADYPIVFIAPETLNTAWYEEKHLFENAELLRLTEEWLGQKNGLAGYNRMLMSVDFYKLFDCEYVLICQTDAFIFRDDLKQWCANGYDYVGAPWISSPKYQYPIFKEYLWLRMYFSKSQVKLTRYHFINRIGNGGLSMRKVSSMIKAAEEYADIAEYYLSKNEKLYQEDVFWSLVPQWFNYPSIRAALKFSFDIKPHVCYQLNEDQLPMGCHGITKSSYRDFWKPFTGFVED